MDAYTMAAEYANQCVAADGPATEVAQQTKVYAGASSAMMRTRHVWLTAHERASHAMTWCDMRGIEYVNAADAVAKCKEAGMVEAK